MASGRLLQSSFTSGELSDELDGSPDLTVYFNGAKTIENCVPLLRGLKRRPGLRMAYELDVFATLIPFVFNSEQAYDIVAVANKFYIFRDKAILTTVEGSELITNGTFATDLTGWTDADNGAGVSEWDFIFAPGGGGIGVMKLATSFAASAGHFAARYQQIATSTGVTYRLEFTVIGLSGEPVVFVGTAAGLADVKDGVVVAGQNTVTFTALSATTFIYFRAPRGTEVHLTNVTCKSVGGIPVEVSTPYSDAALPYLHYRQSADVLYITHPDYPEYKLSRLGEANWDFREVRYDPPPTFEEDEDISEGATLTPDATTGSDVEFTASDDVFLKGDVDRIIVFGQSRAMITAVDDALDKVTADIIDDFPNTDPIPSGQWLLRGPPGTTLDPNRKEPVGINVTLAAAVNCFRPNIVGKYIRIYDGLIEVTAITDEKTIKGVIRSVMGESAGAGKNPSAADEGSWHIEVPSFSDVYGYPATIEFHEGRKAVAGTYNQPTTWWMSASDSYENFARGTLASDAVEYTIASRRVNLIQWLISDGALIIGTAEDEFLAKGSGTDEPIGGENIPLVRPQSSEGSKRIQPAVTSDGVVFVQRTGRSVHLLRYNIESDRLGTINLTEAAGEKIGIIAQGQLAYQKGRINVLYLPRTDGQGLWLRVNLNQEIKGQCGRIVTDGEIQGFSVIPSGDAYQVGCIVKRTINGSDKYFFEYFDDNLHTDCAVTGTISDGASTITGLEHLEGETVDVKLDGVYIGQKTVSAGVVTLDAAVSGATAYEVGLHYDSTIVSMRPAIPGGQTEGRTPRWVRPFARLLNSRGGKINGQDITQTITGETIDPNADFTGDAAVSFSGWNENEGRFTIQQKLPYNFTVLCVGGTLDFS